MAEREQSNAAATDGDELKTQEASAVASTTDMYQFDAEDEEEIREWNLRFLFEDYRFDGPVWQGLQEAGWIYRGGPYQSPKVDGENKQMTFSSAKHICEYLDRFCIPPITNTLQLPPENLLSDMSEEEIKKGKELRKDVVRRVYRRMIARKRKGKQVEKPDKSAETTQEATITRNNVNTMERRSSRRHSSRIQQTNTATAFEKGADTFLRRSREKKTVSSQDIAFLKFPSVNECVKQFRNASSSDIEEIKNSYKQDFDDWKFLLTTQNSLLLYGFGSKRHVLELFARDKLENEGDVLTIDGFDRDVRIESILDLLVEHFLDGEEPQDEENHESCRVGVTSPSTIATHEIVRRATRIAHSLAVKQKKQRLPIYFVLHNIDGPCLRSRDVQEALAALVAHSTITGTEVNTVRLVASIDHVNASALLWDNRTSANFSWVWKEVHTHHPYVEELAVGVVEDERKRHRSKKRQADDMEDATLWNVLASLAPRHAEVVKILATLQSEDLKPVDHVALLRNCKHKMTVTNDSTLRAYLTELSDHGIVETGKDTSTGREWLRIPHSREKLLEIRDFEMDN